MGLFDKLKNVFIEEEEVESEPEEKPKKQEKLEEEKIEPIKEDIVSDRDLIDTNQNFKFPIIFEEEDFKEEKKKSRSINVLERENTKYETEIKRDIKSQKKTIADLKKKLDENCRKRYDTFTDSEITDLLVNRKWYKTIEDGIQNLYITVANHLTKRIAELCERYEDTLPDLTAKLAEEEKQVAAHLEAMGFKL